MRSLCWGYVKPDRAPWEVLPGEDLWTHAQWAMESKVDGCWAGELFEVVTLRITPKKVPRRVSLFDHNPLNNAVPLVRGPVGRWGPGATVSGGTAAGVALRQEVAETIKMLVGDHVEIQYLPARPGDYGGKLVARNKAKELIDWEPKVDFKEGMKRTVQWYKENVSWASPKRRKTDS